MKKIAIVTGGSSGIGKAAALMLCENGYTVSTMGEAAKRFIANWESEKYRKSLAEKA